MIKKTLAKSILAIFLIFSLVNISACKKKTKQENSYTVSFQDYDGSVLKVWKSNSNEELLAPEMPVRKGYKFLGWDKSLNSITGNTVVTAQYAAIKNQLFFDYSSKGDEHTVTLSLCGDVEVCGFEATLSYPMEYLSLENIAVGENAPCEVFFIEQDDSSIKIFFFHDEIENITETFDMLILEFSGDSIAMQEFVLDVTIFVDKDFSPVNFDIANSTYQKIN